MIDATTQDGRTIRVVEILNETPDSQTVKIRNLYSPLFVEMWKRAKDEVTAFHTDIIHDALILGDSKAGDKFLWAYRDTGSFIYRLNGINSDYMLEIVTQIAASACPLKNFHVIEIDKMRQNHADGYITWINCTDREHLKRVIRDVVAA